MAYALKREQLARAALALNAAAGHPPLPALILMTDQDRLPDPVAAARALPRGSAVILRHNDAKARTALARRLVAVSRQRGLMLLIAGDARLAAAIGANGLHLPEARAREAAHWRALRPEWIITAAAHSARALAVAERAGADAVLLAPVFPTASHPGRESLGALKVRAMAQRAALPVYALGGINAQTIARLKGSRLAGIAAIEALVG